MDPALAAMLIEFSKMGLQMYFQAARMAGKTEEEIEAMYQQQKAQFDANRPENLPDV